MSLGTVSLGTISLGGMSPGAIALKLRQTYGHGLITAHYRDRVRLKILQTAPIAQTTDPTCEIHVLTSATDWLNLLWGLKSFYHYSQRRYGLCIHDDGTLTASDRDSLQHHFPQARVLDRPTADVQMSARLASYPRCLSFRTTNHLSPKVFDFIAELRGDRLLLLDSDILFFQPPAELLRRVDDPNYRLNSLNRDVASAYTVDPAIVSAQLGFELLPRVNSGLGLIHKSSLRLDWIEEFLTLPSIIGHFWRIEQTLIALGSSRFGVELLPPAYDVRLDRGIRESPCRHYVGKIRHLMYSEGIRQLVRQNFLKELGA